MVELNLITDVLLFWWGYLFKSTSFNSECIRPNVIISWEMKGTLSFKDFFPSTWVHTGGGKEVELNCTLRKLLCAGSFPSWGIWGMAKASLQDLQVTPCKLMRVEWSRDLGQVCLGYWKLGLSSHLGKFNSPLKTPLRCTWAYSRRPEPQCTEAAVGVQCSVRWETHMLLYTHGNSSRDSVPGPVSSKRNFILIASLFVLYEIGLLHSTLGYRGERGLGEYRFDWIM